MPQEMVYYVQIYDASTGRAISERAPCRVMINDDKTLTVLEFLNLQANEDSDNAVLRWFAFKNAVFYSHQTSLIDKAGLEEIAALKPHQLH